MKKAILRGSLILLSGTLCLAFASLNSADRASPTILCAAIHVNRAACSGKPLTTDEEEGTVVDGPCTDLNIRLEKVPEEKQGFLARSFQSIQTFLTGRDPRLPAEDQKNHVGEYYPITVSWGKDDPTPWCNTELKAARACLQKWNNGWVGICGQVEIATPEGFSTASDEDGFLENCCGTCVKELDQFDACLAKVPNYPPGQYYNSGGGGVTATGVNQKNLPENGAPQGVPAASAPAH